MANVSIVAEADEQWFTLIVGKWRIYIDLGTETLTDADRIKMQEELSYLEGFLESVRKKLSNERFVSNAKPEIIENERKKERDALEKIDVIKRSLA
jgi:valyl-tRNA synthetase